MLYSKYKVPASRCYQIDLAKFIAALLVIGIHTLPLRSFSQLASSLVTQTVCRLAVPFFFVCSGYFCALKVQKGNGGIGERFRLIGHLCSSIGVPYLVWSALWVWLHLRYTGITFYPLSQWERYLYPGLYELLWFMPALLLGEIVYLLLAGREKLYSVVVSVIFLLQIAARIRFPESFMASGFWSGIAFCAVGTCLAKRRLSKPSAPGLGGFVFLCLCGICVFYALEKPLGVLISPNLLLLPASMALFELILRWQITVPGIPSLWFRDMSTLLYFEHGIIIYLLSLVCPPQNALLSSPLLSSPLLSFAVVVGAAILGGGVLILLNRWIPLKKILF